MAMNFTRSIIDISAFGEVTRNFTSDEEYKNFTQALGHMVLRSLLNGNESDTINFTRISIDSTREINAAYYPTAQAVPENSRFWDSPEGVTSEALHKIIAVTNPDNRRPFILGGVPRKPVQQDSDDFNCTLNPPATYWTFHS